MKNKLLKLPRYKVGTVHVTDFESQDWNGKLLTQTNLNKIPIYGTSAITTYGGVFNSLFGVPNDVVILPRLATYCGNFTAINQVNTDHGDTLLKNHINLIGVENSFKTADPTSLFITNDSETILNTVYKYSLVNPFPVSEIDIPIIQPKVLEKRFIGGQLLMFFEVDLTGITGQDAEDDTLGNINGFTAFGQPCDDLGNVIPDDILSTLRSDYTASIIANLNKTIECFDDLKIIFLLFRHESANHILGPHVTDNGILAIEAEIDNIKSVYEAHSNVIVLDLGTIPDDDTDPILSALNIWNYVKDFFKIKE